MTTFWSPFFNRNTLFRSPSRYMASRAVNRRRLVDWLLISEAGGPNGQLWEGLTIERLDASSALEFGRALRLSSTRSGPTIATSDVFKSQKSLIRWRHLSNQTSLPSGGRNCLGTKCVIGLSPRRTLT